MLNSIYTYAFFTHGMLVILAVALLLNGRRAAASTRPLVSAATLLFLLVPTIQAILMKPMAGSGYHDGTATVQFLLGLLLVLLPQVFVHGCTTWLAFHYRIALPFVLSPAQAASRRRKVRLEAAAAAAQVVLLIALFVTAILAILIQPPLPVLAPVVAVLCGLWGAAMTGKRHSYKVDESPRYSGGEQHGQHLDIVVRIADAFGWNLREVQVFRIINRSAASPGRKEDPEQLELGLDRWRNSFDPARPSVPEELISATSPAVLAAGLSMRYAHAALLNPLRWRAIGGFTPWALALLTAAGMLFVAAELILLMLAVKFPAQEAFVGGLFVAALVTFLAGVCSVLMRRRRFHQVAYQAWSSLVPAASPKEFAAALVTYDRAMKPSLSPEAIAMREQNDRRLQAFLRRHQAAA